MKGAYKEKLVTFLYREAPPGSAEQVALGYILRQLRQHFDLDALGHFWDLSDEDELGLFRSAKRPDAIIVHMPHEGHCPRTPIEYPFIPMVQRRLECLDQFQLILDLLRKIKMIADIPVIAYTEAPNTVITWTVFSEASGIDSIIFKTNDGKRDVQEIVAGMENCFEKYEKRPPVVPEPAIKRTGRYAEARVRINLNAGVGLCDAARISKECRRYPGEVIFRKSNKKCPSTSYDAKSIMAILMAALSEGVRITIRVKEDSEDAGALIRRLYSILTARYSFAIDKEIK